MINTPEFSKTINAIQLLLDTRSNLYQARIDRLNEWEPSNEEIVDLLLAIFEEVLLTPDGQSYQSLIGRVSPMVSVLHPLNQAKITAEVIGIAILNDLLDAEFDNEYERYWITTSYEQEDTWIPEKHQPFTSIPKVTDPILGHRFNKGKLNVGVAHLEKMNSIPLVLATDTIKAIKERPTFELDCEDKEKAWELMLRKSQQTYINIVQKKQFYLEHAVDTRGRTYCRGYYINYQGTSYKKAIVQLADKEVIKI